MDRHASNIFLALSLLLCVWTATAARNPQCVSDSADFFVTFRQSRWELDPSFGGNSGALDSIGRLLDSIRNDSAYRLRHVHFTGSASPEGSLKFNRELSENRAMSLFDYLSSLHPLDDAEKSFLFLGRDWEGVLRLAVSDRNVPYRQETVALLRSIADGKRLTGTEPAQSLEKLKRLREGVPYAYLYRNIFPAVRASRVVIGFDRILLPATVTPEIEDAIFACVDSLIIIPADHVPVKETSTIFHTDPCRRIYMDVRSNLLFDALALPNIGAEFYVGNNISLGGNWLYAWWSKNARHRYWRAYAGELFARRWFGSAADIKPLTGHHIGIYGQIYTYDFEWGGKGEMGGKPGGNLWDKAQWGIGLEYGYSLPVTRRLNIDFSLGIGYTTGIYHTYKPVESHYVWQSTSRRKWFGPTKAEVSLVWLIGCGNFNRPNGKNGKGGGQ